MISISGDSIVIKRSRKMLLVSLIVGLIIGALGICFLYSNALAPSGFCKWGGMITTAIGLILIYRSVVYFNIPLIVSSNAGISFDIAVFGTRIFIPRNGIKSIEKENFGMLDFGWKSQTSCLVFRISDDYIKKIPTLLKSVYYKTGDKMYFASGLLAIPAEEALNKLCVIYKG